jgi:hypothetical protein
MYFKNENHQELFTKAIKKMNKKDNVQMSVVYLLTADKKTWQRCHTYMIDNKIPIQKIRIGQSSEEGYTLFCCAKDIALGTTHLSVHDMTDKEMVSVSLWKLLYAAIEIRRRGYWAMRYGKGKDEK